MTLLVYRLSTIERWKKGDRKTLEQPSDEHSEHSDFLEEIVDERSKRNPDFPALMAASIARSMAAIRGKAVNDVPWLRRGVGKRPADGGCILQVIDWINRGEWTDKPPCVHPVLRVAAQTANDEASDEQRQELLDLAPRMMGTEHEAVEATAVVKTLLGSDWYQEPWIIELSLYVAEARTNPIDAFRDVLHVFEQLAGRSPSDKTIDWRPVCELLAQK